MARSRRTIVTLAIVLAATLLAAPRGLDGPAHAAGGKTKKTATPIGYVYTGTISHGIDTLAVAPNHTLSLVTETPSPNGYIGGVTLLHSPGGDHLYVLAGRIIASIYIYDVNPTNGAITLSKVAPVTGISDGQSGNNLFGYDGYGEDSTSTSNVYAEKCLSATCRTYGLAEFHTNLKTGALKLAGKVAANHIDWLSQQGDRIALLESLRKAGEAVQPLTIDHKTGDLKPGTLFHLVTNTHPSKPTTAGLVAAGSGGFAVGNLNLGTGTLAIAVYPGSAGGGVQQDGNVGALTFLPHLLLAGETTNAGGPMLQLVSPSGVTSAGSIDLTKAPYLEGDGGGEQDPNFVETIYQLGLGTYLGTYAGLIVQGTDGVGGKGLQLNQTAPTVTGTGSTTSMTGFLTPATTTTTLAVKHEGSHDHVTGTVSSGTPGVTVTVTLSARQGSKYKAAGKVTTTLTKTAQFSATLNRASQKHCKVTASYPGSPTTAPSKAGKVFAC